MSEMSWREIEFIVEETNLVIIPIGANECYGPHLPTGSDTIVALDVSIILAKRVGAVVAPPIPVGYSQALLGFPGTISISSNVLTDLLRDYCQCLIQSGFRRIFFVCGHLGNIPSITIVANELHEKAIFGMVDLWRFFAKESRGIVETKEIPEGHASEVGTSILLTLHPDLLKLEFAIKELPKSSFYKEMHDVYTFPTLREVSSSGVVGNPLKASRKKGEKILKKSLDSLTEFLQEFKKAKISIK